MTSNLADSQQKKNSIKVLNMQNVCEDVHLLFFGFEIFMPKYKE